MRTLDLVSWIAQQEVRSASAMESAISATQLIRARGDFGQTIKPVEGSVLASPTIANWDPEPDYFFHWLRDSAITMRVVAELSGDAPESMPWRKHFENFVHFSWMTSNLRGDDYLRHNDYQGATKAACRRFLRKPDEILALADDMLLCEPRFNPDGTIDIFRWSRPQYDGPALRALACLRYLRAGGTPSAELLSLLRRDLEFTLRHAGKPSIGPWEEPEACANHYYVALTQLGALVHGRAWLRQAKELDETERLLRLRLEEHWCQRDHVFIAVWPARADPAENLVDASIVLAVLDADLPDGQHSVADTRVRETVEILATVFANALPINRTRFAGRAPALGRYLGDKYFGGGAWYVTTLAAAEFYYRLAAFPGQDCSALLNRGDEFMTTVRELTPETGELSEQVNRETGLQQSASRLTWSHAAFVSAAGRRSLAQKVLEMREPRRQSLLHQDIP